MNGSEKISQWNLTEADKASIPDIHTLAARLPPDFHWVRDRNVNGVYFNTIGRRYSQFFSLIPDAKGTPFGEHQIGFVEALFTPLQAYSLSEYGTALKDQGLLEPTDEAHHHITRLAAYNDPLCVYLMHQLMPVFEWITGEKLQPSYAFFSRYLAGSALGKHTDVPRCPFNVSIQLNTVLKPEHVESSVRVSWPLHIEVTPGNTRRVVLSDGDAAVYLGTKQPHWRETMSDKIEYVDVLLFHYLPRE
jgi:hypothetical protein